MIQQSTPFMSPIRDLTTSCQVFLFGDLATHFEDELRQLLYVEGNESLRSFFEQVSFALREECGKLPSYQQELFPRFTTLSDLISKLGETEGTPALRFCLLSVCEIGQFLRHFGEGSNPYPAAGNSYCLGLCTGSFAAAAISTSQTLSELIPAGVEAALTAFRTALRSLVVRNDIAKPASGTRLSWSAVVNAQEDDASKLLDTFCSTKRLPHSVKPYLSASTSSNVTVSGSPSALEDFVSTNALKAHYLPIESPYHAPHLFKTQDVDEIISQFHEPLASYKPRIPVWSAASGKPITATDFKSLLHEVVADTLCRPVQWKRILESAVEFLQQAGVKECAISAISSNAATLLSSAISKGAQIQTTVNTLSCSNHSVPRPFRPSGRFEQSKIAIVGYSGRFPDAASNEEFWDLLHAGKDVHRHIPEDRFDWKAHFDPTGKAKNTSKIQYGCFIKEPGLFDSRFFNISPKEAENTDPAQRLAITTTYEALEMSGIVPNRTPSTQQDRIGVYFGVTSDDWREVNSGQDVGTYFIPGGNRAFVPGRISYFFRFSGPSLSIDTACSSSFAAIQTACGTLWRGECDTAVAGGTNVLTNPDNFAGLDRGHFLSTTGNCNAFDDEASGYCRADAVGSVILKRLEDAEADNDPIFGVIAGAFTNHCGQTESITRPHEGDQASVFKKIIRRANVDPQDISYVEMHGTGTQAGDATEMNSVLSVMVPERRRTPEQPLYLGSAKANIGHGESASGVSSLIKVLMMMKNNEIPPHCGIKTKINHNYPPDLKERNVNIALKPVPWNRTDSASGKRSVFLNNFSAAGGNTALLLEDAPLANYDVDGDSDPRSVHLVTLTAKSAKSLTGNVNALINFLQDNMGTSLPKLSYTTTARRIHHNYRTIVSASSIKSVLEGLKKRLEISEFRPIPNATKIPKVAFVFTGQGTLYTSMGKQLFESISSFKADILRFDSIAQQQGFPSFLPLVDGSAMSMEDVEVTAAHLALTCVQIAICRLWTSWGIHPTLTTGHSLGEYAALYAAGVLTVSDTIYLVGTRAQLLLNHCRQGTHAMLAVKATVKDMETHLVGSPCQIACMNQPTSNVISGPNEEVDRLMNLFQQKGFECIRLDIPFAFHSAQVDPILEEFESAAGSIHFHDPSVPYVSPLLGEVVSDGAALNASYLSQACRNPVNFQGALDASKASSLTDDQTIWLEIGLHPACSGMVKGTIGSKVTTVPSLRKGTDTWKVLAAGLETFYLNGINIEWNEWHRDFKASHKVLQLPKYSWDLKNYWIQYRNNFCLTKGEGMTPKQITGEQAEQKPSFIYLSPSVQRILEEHHAADISTLLVESDIQDPRLAPVVQGHKVNGATLCPSSLYADIALTMANYMLKKLQMPTDNVGLDVGDMQIDQTLIAQPGGISQFIQVSASADWKANTIAISLYSVNDQGKKTTSHATCQVRITPDQTWQQEWKRNAYLIKSRIAMLRKGVDEGDSHKLKCGMVYKLFASLVDYEPQYQGMREVILDSNELEATSQVSFQVDEDGHYFNPCWVDSLGHIAGFIMNGNDNTASKSQVFVNHGWDGMRCATKFVKGKTYQTYNKMQLVNGTLYAGDTYILDEGNVVAIFEGVRFQGVPRRVLDLLLPSKGPETNPRPTATKSAKPMDRPSTKTPTKNDVAPVKSSPSSIFPQVLAIISEEVGIDTAELKPESEFTEFGIDSLLSLTVSGRLREELGLDLPGGIFLEYPTVKEFQTHIDGAQDPSLTSGSSSKDDTEVFTPDTASDQGIERHNDVIRATISDETGIPIEELTDSAKLSELGIDSLLALTTMGKLSEALEMELPRTLFAENDTLGELERALDAEIQQANGISVADPVKVEDITHLDDVDSAPRATSILLQGNPKTATKKLFMFPDGSGSATSYSSLASISADVAVYGLNCPWMKTPQDMKCNLEYLSSKYLVEIRRRQPNGPYYFGGWSAGGICAYEAAQQLSRNGEQIARLILIDSPNPIGLENPPQRMYDFFESVGIFGSEGKAPPSWLRPHFDAFIRLLDDYSAKAFERGPIETHMVYARDGICKNPEDPRPEIRPDDPREMIWLLNNRTDFSGSGWAHLVGENNLKIHVLDNVNHFSMMDPGPMSEELGAFIKRAMG